jgi:hypothetical protein
MKYLLMTFVIVATIIIAIIISGCVSSDKNTMITPTPASTKIASTLPTKITPKPTLSAEQAKEMAGIALNMTAEVSKSLLSPENYPKMPNGKPFPVDGVVGDPIAKTVNGVPVWEIPVLSNGVRVGELYLKREQ